MTLFETRIREWEARPANLDAAERARRIAALNHIAAINRFEGIIPTPDDQRLFDLLAAGKVSKHEYLELCLADATDARG